MANEIRVEKCFYDLNEYMDYSGFLTQAEVPYLVFGVEEELAALNAVREASPENLENLTRQKKIWESWKNSISCHCIFPKDSLSYPDTHQESPAWQLLTVHDSEQVSAIRQAFLQRKCLRRQHWCQSQFS